MLITSKYFLLKFIIYFHQPLILFDFFCTDHFMNIWLNNFLFLFTHWQICQETHANLRHIAEKRSQFGCWLLLLFIFLLFTFFLSCFFFFCLLFVTSHTLSSNIPNYFLTTRFSWFFSLLFFFFRLVLKNHDFVIFMIFLTASMLILRGPSFCFRCGFAGMDLVFIYMTHSCGVKYFLNLLLM